MAEWGVGASVKGGKLPQEIGNCGEPWSSMSWRDVAQKIKVCCSILLRIECLGYRQGFNTHVIKYVSVISVQCQLTIKLFNAAT